METFFGPYCTSSSSKRYKGIHVHTVNACTGLSQFSTVALTHTITDTLHLLFLSAHAPESRSSSHLVSVYLPVCLSVCLSVSLFVCLSVSLSVYLSVSLFVCLSVADLKDGGLLALQRDLNLNRMTI